MRDSWGMLSDLNTRVDIILLGTLSVMPFGIYSFAAFCGSFGQISYWSSRILPDNWRFTRSL